MTRKISIICVKTPLASALLAFAACTANYEDINTNPNDATKDQMGADAYIESAALTGMQGWVIPLQEHQYQFIENLMGGPFGGYMADSGSWDTRTSLYNPTDDWTRPAFQVVMPEIYKNYVKLQANTEDAVILAVAEVVRAAAIHRVTDIYGPIPYSQIGRDGALTAPYDSQEKVYETLITQIDNALDVLEAHRTGTFNHKADKIYGGSVMKWIRFANSLKLRMALRLSYANEEWARTVAEQAAPNAMIDNSDNALMPVAKNPNTQTVNSWRDSRISADLTSYMNGYADPRRAAYFTKAGTANEGYNGLRSGVRYDERNRSEYSGMVVENATPIAWMYAAEVAFLKAEADLRGWEVGGEAVDFYKKGIELSFQQWGLTGADVYMQNAAAMPAAYNDPTGRYSAPRQSTISIPFDTRPEADFEENLERIITQKWIASFPLGNEAWSEYRRTGYPRLLPSPTASGMGVELGGMPGRVPYPQNEFTDNAPNYAEALQLLGGPDDMASRVWWDCKTKN